MRTSITHVGSAAMGAGHCRPGDGAFAQAVLASAGSGQAAGRRRGGAGAGVGRIHLVASAGI